MFKVLSVLAQIFALASMTINTLDIIYLIKSGIVCMRVRAREKERKKIFSVPIGCSLVKHDKRLRNIAITKINLF